MPFKKGVPNLRGGRKSKVEENGRFDILNQAWQIVRDWIKDEHTPLKERRTVALELVKKSVPQNIDPFTGKTVPVLVQFIDGK